MVSDVIYIASPVECDQFHSDIETDEYVQYMLSNVIEQCRRSLAKNIWRISGIHSVNCHSSQSICAFIQVDCINPFRFVFLI